jgi:hypothetical protein
MDKFDSEQESFISCYNGDDEFSESMRTSKFLHQLNH